MNKTDIPNSVLFPCQVPIEFLPTVFPTTTLRVSVNTNFVREVPLDLQCLTTIWAIGVVSIRLDILTLEF